MFKQVMIGLFTIVMVAMLWTKANAGCAVIDGYFMCADYISGGVEADLSITCEDSALGCISAPVKDNVLLFGNIPDPFSCIDNSTCDMSGDLVCDGVHHPRTVLIHDKDVHFPLTGKGNMNCTNGSCSTSITVELSKCGGGAPNCCFGPDCVCPSSTTNMDWIPDGGAFEATFTQNPGAKTGARQATIN